MSSRINALSTVPDLVPQSSEVILGQFAINAADGKVYLKKTSGQMICIGADVGQFASEQDLQSAIAGLDLSDYALTADVAQSLATVAQELQGLAEALAGKAPVAHTHPITEVAQLGATLSGLQASINALNTQITNGLASKAGIAGVTGAFTVGNNFQANVVASNNHIIAGTSYRVGTNNVVRAPNPQGWQNPTGPQSTAAFNSSAVTLNELARRVAAIQSQLIYHGLLSTQGTTIQ
jgi:hypothetical protein